MIIDCLCLFNELDILEWRLTELYPAVDWFVLVESTHTHKGDPKPLHYAQNRQRFARWNDKVLHVVVDKDTTDGDGLPAIRRREMEQRNAILEGLKHIEEESATILISDADEIPRREIIQSLKGQTIPDGMVVRFIQRLYYYDFNTSAPDRPWPGTRAARLADVRAMSPHIIRNGMGQPDGHYPLHGQIVDGGWHCSYFGGVDKIREKQQAFLHQELVNEQTTAPAVVEERRRLGLDIWGREGEQTFVHGPASDLPWAVRSDPERWAAYFHEDWRPTFHENWLPADQAMRLGWLAQQAPQEGACVEIGSWEGRSSIAIAQSIQPRVLHCVDHWKGNIDEGDAQSTKAAEERDVDWTFMRNMGLLTQGNKETYPYDWRDWISTWEKPIAFLHLDASHDYTSVKDCLEAIKPFLVPGAVLCGDDFYAEGVNRATREVLPGVQDMGGRLWVWQAPLKEEVP